MNNNKKQDIFHMFPQSVMKYFFYNELNINGFIIYDFKNRTFSKKQVSIKGINSINLKRKIIPSNIQKFEEELNKNENEYADFFSEAFNYSNEFDEINIFYNPKTKIELENKVGWEKFEQKWKKYQNKTLLNLSQFLYYLTIQLKYFNTIFLNESISENNIEKLMTFLKLDIEKKNLLNNDEKQWFWFLENLKSFTYAGSFILNTKEYMSNFSFNTCFNSGFTSNPISITQINKRMISFVMPFTYSKSLTIIFIDKKEKEKRKREIIYSEYKRANLLSIATDQFMRIMAWRYVNYNFWNKEKNVLIPNRDILDTRLIYYPFDIFSHGFGCEKKIWDRTKEIIEYDLETSLLIFAQNMKKKKPAYQHFNYFKYLFNYKNNNNNSEIKKRGLINIELFKENGEKMEDYLRKEKEVQIRGSLIVFYYMVLKYNEKIEYNDLNFKKEYKKTAISLAKKWNIQNYNFELIISNI